MSRASGERAHRCPLGGARLVPGPTPELVGAGTDGVTFFVGSIFFTAGGLVQTSLSFQARRQRAANWSTCLGAACLACAVLGLRGRDVPHTDRAGLHEIDRKRVKAGTGY